jgi:hypothetical protein
MLATAILSDIAKLGGGDKQAEDREAWLVVWLFGATVAIRLAM